jgi:hypothetical protein
MIMGLIMMIYHTDYMVRMNQKLKAKKISYWYSVAENEELTSSVRQKYMAKILKELKEEI